MESTFFQFSNELSCLSKLSTLYFPYKNQPKKETDEMVDDDGEKDKNQQPPSSKNENKQQEKEEEMKSSNQPSPSLSHSRSLSTDVVVNEGKRVRDDGR